MAEIEIEPSVHMRLYSMNKRHFATIFLLFVLQIGILVIISVAGPPINEELCINMSDINRTDIDLRTGPFILKTFPLSPFNQQLWMSMMHSVENSDDAKFDLSFTTTVSIQGISEEQTPENIRHGTETKRSVTLTCSYGKCDKIPLVHLSHLFHPYYVVNVRTHGLESLQFKITDVNFQILTFGSAFTQLQIWFKFAFLILSFLATCLFAYSLRKFSVGNWSMEQRWMTLLLPLLILYNNPVFSLMFLVSSWVPGSVDVFFQVSFMAGLLLFWLCAYHGVRQVKRKFGLFYLPKILLVGCLWFTVVFFSTWYRLRNLYDPTDIGEDLKFKVVVGILFAAYLLYLVYLVVRAFAELRSMPYFDLRLKFITCMIASLAVVASAVAATARSGPSPSGLGFGFLLGWPTFPPPSTTLEFVLLHGLVNLHVLVMAFVYAPSSNAYYESHFKDNPALSMLNDSEDEVIYGEEISLTSNRPVKHGGGRSGSNNSNSGQHSNNKYDSEEDAFN